MRIYVEVWFKKKSRCLFLNLCNSSTDKNDLTEPHVMSRNMFSHHITLQCKVMLWQSLHVVFFNIGTSWNQFALYRRWELHNFCTMQIDFKLVQISNKLMSSVESITKNADPLTVQLFFIFRRCIYPKQQIFHLSVKTIDAGIILQNFMF